MTSLPAIAEELASYDQRTYSLAWAMYVRMTETYDADKDEVNNAWLDDPGVRKFWLDNAQHAIEHLDSNGD